MEHMYMLRVHKPHGTHALYSDAVLVARQARLTRVAASFKQKKEKKKLTLPPPSPHIHARYLSLSTVTASSLHPARPLSFVPLTFLPYDQPPPDCSHRCGGAVAR